MATVAQDFEVGAGVAELLQKIEGGAVCAARADDVAEAEDPPLHAEALGVRGDEGLASELAGAVERDGQAAEIELTAGLGGIAIDRA